MTDAEQVRAALALAADVGGFFAVDVDTLGDDWRPLRELVDGALADRVEFARANLTQRAGAEIGLRVSASINSLGVLSRLVAPALACATLAGIVPVLGLDTVSWRPVDGGPLPMAFRATSARPVADATQAADAIVELVIDPVVEPLLAAYRTGFGVSPRTLWGNVASALNGAAGLLPVTRIDPVDVVAALLARRPLAGAGHYGRVAGRRFVRHNCCQLYRVAGAGTCADCVLTR